MVAMASTWLPFGCHPPPSPQAVRKVLGSRHGGEWEAARGELRRNLEHAPKLAALQELLLDAGGWLGGVGLDGKLLLLLLALAGTAWGTHTQAGTHPAEVLRPIPLSPLSAPAPQASAWSRG